MKACRHWAKNTQIFFKWKTRPYALRDAANDGWCCCLDVVSFTLPVAVEMDGKIYWAHSKRGRRKFDEIFNRMGELPTQFLWIPTSLRVEQDCKSV